MKLVFLLLSIGWALAISDQPVRHFDLVSVTSISIEPFRLNLTLSLFNASYEFRMEKNQQLLMPHATVQVIGMNKTRPLNVELFAYHGRVYTYSSIYGMHDIGWVRATFSEDPASYVGIQPIFEGAFESIYTGLHHIKSIATYLKSKKDTDQSMDSEQEKIAGMVVFRDIDEQTTQSITDNCVGQLQAPTCIPRIYQSLTTGLSESCGNSPEMNLLVKPQLNMHLSRALSPLKKRSLSGCPSSQRVLPMAAAVDCNYVSKLGGASAALKQLLADYNTANAVYQSTFNVTLAIISVRIYETCGSNGETPNPKWNTACSSSYTMTDQLSDFSEWRGAKSSDSAGLWQLLTTCTTGSTIGLAWTGLLCQKTSETTFTEGKNRYASGTSVSALTTNSWKVIAHEIGHNFGAIHDCSGSSCPSSNNNPSCCPCKSSDSTSCSCQSMYMMNAFSNIITNSFSPCSVEMICGFLPEIGTCLLEPDELTATVASGVCGNGVKESGEDCDCGTNCDTDPCCTSSCKFKNGAVCHDKNDMCCSGCNFKANGTLCRSSIGACDVAEYCNGRSASCPRDVFAASGKTCGDGLTCASGVCTNRDLQCKSKSAFISPTGACTSRFSSCEMNCAIGSSCYQLNGFFIDGTPCEGGYCVKGVCAANSIVTDPSTWTRSWVFWAVLAAVLLLLVMSIICITRRCRRKAVPAALPNAPMAYPAAYPNQGYQPYPYPAATYAPPGATYPVATYAPPGATYPVATYAPPGPTAYPQYPQNGMPYPVNAPYQPSPNQYPGNV